MNIRKNILLALASGLLLGLPWSVPSLFFLVFIAWVPLLRLEEQLRHHANSYAIFNYAFVSFLLWNILGTWWITQVQLVGAILIILANSLIQALIFRLASLNNIDPKPAQLLCYRQFVIDIQTRPGRLLTIS